MNRLSYKYNFVHLFTIIIITLLFKLNCIVCQLRPDLLNIQNVIASKQCYDKIATKERICYSQYLDSIAEQFSLSRRPYQEFEDYHKKVIIS